MGRIQEFFTSKTVLVTGATGFLGGVLLERLLSSCPGLKEVLVVARPRNGMSPKDRLRQLLSLQLFEKLSEEVKAKVSLIAGDLSLPELGVEAGDLERIRKSVHVVFHVAASVNFSSTLDKAVRTNLGGTAAILDLAKQMTNLKALIYVSTAYCNCMPDVFIEEKVYPSRYDPLELLHLVMESSPENINRQTNEYLTEHPNTYAFTKHLAENLLATQRCGLPVAIVRPSIVLNTAERPVKGWTYNVQSGAFAFIAGAGRGAFRTILADGSAVVDLVPSDYFAAFLIAAAVRTAQRSDLQVYHYTSGTISPILWSDYVSKVMKKVEEFPVDNALLPPRAECRSSHLRNWFVVLLFHYLPAFFIDLFNLAIDAPYKVLDIQKKYARGMTYASYFTLNQWYFDTANTTRLWREMSNEDRKEFWFSMEDFDWDRYIKTCVLGVRCYYHNQDLSKLGLARSLHARRKICYYCGWGILYFLLVSFLKMFISSNFSCFAYGLVVLHFLYWV